MRSATQRLRESGSDTPRLDAELLLGHVLGIDRASLLAHPEAPVGQGQLEAFAAALERRAAGEPVAYIRGLKEFFSLALAVDQRALIPRPETERVVELALERLSEMLTAAPRPELAPPLRAWDVGTGSGAVAVALAVEARRRGYGRDVRVLATDASPEALALALENAVAHGVADVVEFATADLLELPAAGRADLVLANLPYIPSADVPGLPVAASFEPVGALDGGPDGLVHIRRLLGGLSSVLVPGGSCLLEIGDKQADAVVAAAESLLPGWHHAVYADLAGLPRVVEVRPPSQPG
ncbi:MAG TPA: peptide chain release factor N(5)-glutamine methyltransferase [Candidatus Limnocylindria bacterium]|nr:peptide chain release factor N(5)-glutamine methyltransferase [Candidatus Limnocylindria bacterium]